MALIAGGARIRVVLHLAVVTVRNGPGMGVTRDATKVREIGRVEMALVAFEFVRPAADRERRVIERRACPCLGRVTGLAVGSETSSRVIWARRLLEILQMAADARRGQAGIDASLVTIGTREPGVPVGERE